MYHIRSYSVGKPTVRFPKQVVFGEHGRVIVGGSDTGRIFIFDRESGAMLDALKHADGGLVQSVVVCQIPLSIAPTSLLTHHRLTPVPTVTSS